MKTITTRIISKIRNLVDAIKNAFAAPYATPLPPFGPATMPYTNAVLLNLCGNDHGRALEVMRWLAGPLRAPGEKLPQALWVRGDQGTGKSMFFNDLIAPMYGAAAATISGNTFNGWFNGWASGKRLAVVDPFEYSFESIQRFKSLITSNRLHIERKGHAASMERNQLNMIFLSGSPDVLPMSGDTTRRFMVVDAGPALAHEYYAGMAEEIRQGGVQTYLQFLVEQLDNPFHVGDTDAPAGLAPQITGAA
jgi:putative DNA primase/helicase